MMAASPGLTSASLTKNRTDEKPHEGFGLGEFAGAEELAHIRVKAAMVSALSSSSCPAGCGHGVGKRSDRRNPQRAPLRAARRSNIEPTRVNLLMGLDVPSSSSRGAQPRGDLVPGAAFLAPTRLPRCAGNDSSRELGTHEVHGPLEDPDRRPRSRDEE